MEFGLFTEFESPAGMSDATAFDEALAQMKAAEELGLDAVWLAEIHSQKERSVLSSPLVVAAALAASTRRIKIGIAVQVLPLSHPLRLAEDVATVDHLDFWNEEFAGRRGTYTITNTLGINFLFMANKVYGRDFFDMDAGLAAVKRLQPKIVDFTGTMEKLLEQKEVAIAVLHDGSAFDLAKRGLPIGWVAPSEGVPILDQVAHVTRGSKHKDLTWKLIDAYLSPEVQQTFATELYFSPTNRSVKLPPEVAGKIISGPKEEFTGF